MTETGANARGFGTAWDDYAARGRAGGQRWPGDEWGDRELWQHWFDRLLGAHGAASWRRAIEIGQGTGKYTELLLAAGTAEVLVCDVSERFLALCRERLAGLVAAGRLHAEAIDERDANALVHAAAAVGWQDGIDAVFAIDAFVHLPLSHVVAYALSASELLRDGGVLAFTFACATSQAGRAKMLGDVSRTLAAGSTPDTGCFHWLSPELVDAVLTGLGYRTEICDVDPFHRRDGHYVGRLTDRAAADAARALRDGA